MGLPARLLTLFPTIGHAPAPSAPLCIFFATDLAADHPINLLLMLSFLPPSFLLRLGYELPGPDVAHTAPTDWVDLDHDHGLGEMEA